MCELLIRTAKIAKTPSDGRGTFSFFILAFDSVDHDGEIIAGYTNVGEKSNTVVPMDYGHMALLGAGADPLAQKIGTASVSRAGKLLRGDAQLDLSNQVAMMCYERIQLPSDDPAHLGELSVWFAFDPSKTSVDADGVKTIRDAELLSVAVVREGAQATSIDRIKRAFGKCAIGPNGEKTCSPADHFRRAQPKNISGNRRGLPGVSKDAQHRARLSKSVADTEAKREVEARAARRKLYERFVTDEGHSKKTGGDAYLQAVERRISLEQQIERDAIAVHLEQREGGKPGTYRVKVTRPEPKTVQAEKAAAEAAKLRTYMEAPLGAMRSSTKIDARFRVINESVTPAPTGPPETYRLPVVDTDDGKRRGPRP